MTRSAFNSCGLRIFLGDAPATIAIDVRDQLAAKRQIAVIWSIEDVRELRPDLTDDQAWDVLQDVEINHDASIGITWETLQVSADEMFPLAPTPQADGRGA